MRRHTRAMEPSTGVKSRLPRPSSRSLSAMLDNFSKYEVTPRQTDKSCTQIRVISRVIEPLLQTVGEIDDRFRNAGLTQQWQCSTADGLSSARPFTSTMRPVVGTTRPRPRPTTSGIPSWGRPMARHNMSLCGYTHQPPPVNRLIGMNKNNFHEFDLLVAMENVFVDVRHAASGGGGDDSAGGGGRPRNRHGPNSSTQDQTFGVKFLDSTRCNNPYTQVLDGYGYVAINMESVLVQDLTSDLFDSVDTSVGHGFASEAYLCPHKFLHKFTELISEAIEILNGKCYWEREPTVFEVNVCRQESGVKLKIVLAGESFSVELLPALLLQSWPDSLKSWYKLHSNNKWLSSHRIDMVNKELHLISDTTAQSVDERLWKVCYEKSEHTLVEYADYDQIDSCRYKAYSVLETVLEENAADFAPMTPRLLRNIFIEECIRYPHDEDWCSEKLGRVFIDLFKQVIKSIKNGECSHVFTQTNLFQISYRKCDLKQISIHLGAILHDIVKHPNKSALLAINY